MSADRLKPGPTSRITRAQVLRAAELYFVHGETQTDIAKEMGVSPSYLTRLLKSARETGEVQIFVAADRETQLSAALLARYPNLLHVDVVPSGPTPQSTARALGTAMAAWFNDLLERDEDSGKPQIWNVAIGGGMVHQAMVEQLHLRTNRISVGPTALTPERGRVARFTASTLSAFLALRFNALTPGDREPDPATRTGYRYNLTVEPPRTSLSALRAWYAELQGRPEYLEMLEFWRRCDVVFVSAVGVDWAYKDVRERLVALGLSLEEMKERGAVALVANQFVDAAGNLVPLADGVPGYEPALPVPLLKHLVARERTEGRRAHVVLDVWGPPAFDLVDLLGSPAVNVLLADTAAGHVFRG